LPMARRLRSLAVHAFPSASRWRSRVGERRLHVSSACRDLVRAGGDAGVHHSFDRAAISLVRNDLRRRLRNGCWQISFAARVRRRTRQLDGSNDRRVGFAPCLRALATARCEVLRDRAAATDGRLTSRRSCRRRAPALRAGADGLAMRLVTPAAGTNFVAPRKVSLPSCRIPAQTRPFPWSQEGVAMALRETIAALELQHSEAVVVHAASRIFAALAASGQVTEANA